MVVVFSYKYVVLPMGTDCASRVANLHLLFYELEYILRTRASNYGICLALRNVFRYIDDITAINDKGEFEQNIGNIYLASLELCKVNSCNHSADVLDISVSINNNKFKTKLYDKRNDFNFETNNFPHYNSNMPSNMLYNCFSSQILRYSRICSECVDFLFNSKLLYNKLEMKNYSTERLLHTAKQTFRRNQQIATKFSLSETEFLKNFEQ